LVAVIGLALFSAWVFQYYDRPTAEVDHGPVILSEVVTDSDVCMFTVGRRLTHTSRRYRSALDLRPGDDLARGLLAVPGIVEVSIHERSVTLLKVRSARWENIQPAARGIITDFLRDNKRP